MKVLHINRNYMTTALHQIMIEHLDEQKVDSVVFAPTENKKLAVITPKENVVVSQCFNKFDRYIFSLKQAKIKRALCAATDPSEYDLIHAYTLFTDGNCAMKLSKKYHIPYVVAVRNTDVNDFFKKLPHLRHRGIEIMRNAAAVCFLSETYRKQVFEKYLPEKYKAELMKKTYIIPNGIDDFYLNNMVETPASCHSERIRDHQVRLVYAGRIDKNKNIPTTVKAMELLKKKGITASLTVVGKVKDKGEYKKITESPLVTYIPPKKKEELIDIYRENDVFVMPSFTESFGLVYAEAMSQGLPVVYSKGQGFDGQFPEGTVGKSADARSAESVAEAISAVLADYDTLSASVGDKSKCFCWGEIAKRYHVLYNEVAEKKQLSKSETR